MRILAYDLLEKTRREPVKFLHGGGYFALETPNGDQMQARARAPMATNIVQIAVAIFLTAFLSRAADAADVQLYLFAPYAGGKTIAQLLAKQLTNVSQLQRTNRN